MTGHVVENKQEFMDDLNACEPPFAMVPTAVPNTYAGTQSMSTTGDSFVLLCSVDDCVVIDSHCHNSYGSLKGYKKGLHSAETIVSFICEPKVGLLAMMGCVSNQLHVVLAHPSPALQEAVHCESEGAVSEHEVFPRASIAKEQT